MSVTKGPYNAMGALNRVTVVSKYEPRIHALFNSYKVMENMPNIGKCRKFSKNI